MVTTYADINQWLTFDWDTLQVVEGLADIHLEFQEAVRSRDGTASVMSNGTEDESADGIQEDAGVS